MATATQSCDCDRIAKGECPMRTYSSPMLTVCGDFQAFITALGVAESTILLALSFPHLIPTRVVNLLTYGSSSIVPLSANSFHPLSAFVSTSPVSLAPFILGTCLIIGGAILRQWCFKTMGNMFTYEVVLMKEHKLVTSGPYAYVRHPSYTGVAMIYAGLAIWQISPGSWVRASGVLDIAIGKACLGFVLASMAIFSERSLPMYTLSLILHTAVGSITRMPKEDNLLRARFGRQWDEWAKNVPYRLVPYVY